MLDATNDPNLRDAATNVIDNMSEFILEGLIMNYYLVGDLEGCPLVKGDGKLPSPQVVAFPDGRVAIALNSMEKFGTDIEAMSFILYHELGHVVNGDKKYTAKRLSREFGCNLVGMAAREEVLADLYAIKRSGMDLAKYEDIIRRVHLTLLGDNSISKWLAFGRIRSVRKAMKKIQG